MSCRKFQFSVLTGDLHGISLPDFSFQDELRELIFNEILARALQRSRAIFLILSFLAKVFLHVITAI